VLHRTLKLATPHMTGADVKVWQSHLIAAGFKLPRFGADGDYGSETVAGTRSWQASKGLPVTGIVDADDWKGMGL
jgi:peptidoglycan hydrolase-like protein with peptidoglycan-binding domain